jgi:hypothetical protein
MNQRFFLTSLAVTSLFIAALQWGFQHYFTIFQSYAKVTWWSLAFFILFSYGMFLIGKRAAKSQNRGLFTNLIMALTFFKMMLAVMVLVVYKKMFQPASKDFLLPFFFVYFTFTIFETYFMIKLGKEQ